MFFKRLQHPSTCEKFKIIGVRDLTTGYDNTQPDNKAVSIHSTSFCVLLPRLKHWRHTDNDLAKNMVLLPNYYPYSFFYEAFLFGKMSRMEKWQLEFRILVLAALRIGPEDNKFCSFCFFLDTSCQFFKSNDHILL
jgi:hypothetical protein